MFAYVLVAVSAFTCGSSQHSIGGGSASLTIDILFQPKGQVIEKDCFNYLHAIMQRFGICLAGASFSPAWISQMHLAILVCVCPVTGLF